MDFSKLKLLVVDDSPMVRNHVEAVLKKLGVIRVDKAENGKDALLKVKKAYNDGLPYSLICLDWEMPELTGLELLKVLRQDEKMRSTRVLMISSKASAAELKELAPLRPNGYLVKPFTDEDLEQRVRQLLS